MLILALHIAVIAFVYSVILTQGGEALNGWYKFLEKHIGDKWYFKPIIDCNKCVAGQLALWIYLVRFWNAYDPLQHIALIAYSILFSVALNIIYERTRI